MDFDLQPVLEIQDEDHKTLLDHAIRCLPHNLGNTLVLLAFLVEKGLIDLSVRYNQGDTLLHHVFKSLYSSLQTKSGKLLNMLSLESTLQQNLPYLTSLIENTKDITNSTNDLNETPLSLAVCLIGSKYPTYAIPIIFALTKNAVNVAKIQNPMVNCLYDMIIKDLIHEEVLDYCIENGADLDFIDINGDSLIHIMLSKMNELWIFQNTLAYDHCINNGAHLDFVDNNYDSLIHITLSRMNESWIIQNTLAEYDPLLINKLQTKITALEVALLRIINTTQKNIDLENKKGETPFYCVISYYSKHHAFGDYKYKGILEALIRQDISLIHKANKNLYFFKILNTLPLLFMKDHVVRARNVTGSDIDGNTVFHSLILQADSLRKDVLPYLNNMIKAMLSLADCAKMINEKNLKNETPLFLYVELYYKAYRGDRKEDFLDIIWTIVQNGGNFRYPSESGIHTSLFAHLNHHKIIGYYSIQYFTVRKVKLFSLDYQPDFFEVVLMNSKQAPCIEEFLMNVFILEVLKNHEYIKKKLIPYLDEPHKYEIVIQFPQMYNVANISELKAPNVLHDLARQIIHKMNEKSPRTFLIAGSLLDMGSTILKRLDTEHLHHMINQRDSRRETPFQIMLKLAICHYCGGYENIIKLFGAHAQLCTLSDLDKHFAEFKAHYLLEKSSVPTIKIEDLLKERVNVFQPLYSRIHEVLDTKQGYFGKIPLYHKHLIKEYLGVPEPTISLKELSFYKSIKEKTLTPRTIKENWTIFIQLSQHRQQNIVIDAFQSVVTSPEDAEKRSAIIKKVIELSSNDDMYVFLGDSNLIKTRITEARSLLEG